MAKDQQDSKPEMAKTTKKRKRTSEMASPKKKRKGDHETETPEHGIIQPHFGGYVVNGDPIIVINGDLERLNGHALHLKGRRVISHLKNVLISETFSVSGIIKKVKRSKATIKYEEAKHKVIRGDNNNQAVRSTLPEAFKLKQQSDASGKEETIQGFVEICYLPGVSQDKVTDEEKKRGSFPAISVCPELGRRAIPRILKSMKDDDHAFDSSKIIEGDDFKYLAKNMVSLSDENNTKTALNLAAYVWNRDAKFFAVTEQLYFSKLREFHSHFGNKNSRNYIGRILSAKKIFPGATYRASDIYEALYSVYNKHFMIQVREDKITKVKHLSHFKFTFDKYGLVCDADYAKRFRACNESDQVFIDLEYALENIKKCDTFRFPTDPSW